MQRVEQSKYWLSPFIKSALKDSAGIGCQARQVRRVSQLITITGLNLSSPSHEDQKKEIRFPCVYIISFVDEVIRDNIEG